MDNQLVLSVLMATNVIDGPQNSHLFHKLPTDCIHTVGHVH